MKNLTSFLTALGVAALAQPAFSHTTLPASWPSFPQPMSSSAVSFPVGNTYRDAIEKIDGMFRSENPSEMYFTMAYDDPGVGMNNGQNENWFTSDTSVTGVAVTFYWYSGTDLLEADIVSYNGLNWTTSFSKTSIISYGGASRPFHTTCLHEFGHAAGLGHEADEYNIMGQDWDHISCNSSTYDSYIGEDAANGLVSIYGLYSGMIEDAGVTAFKYSGPSGAYSAHTLCEVYDTFGNPLPSTSFSGQRRYEVGPGQSFQVEFTFENNGATSQTFDVGYYLSTNDLITTFDDLLLSTSFFMSRDNVLTTTRTLTLPNNLNVDQTYYIGVLIDDDNVLVEGDEGNNAAYHPVLIDCDVSPTVSFYNSGPNPSSLTTSNFTTGDNFSLTVNLNTSGHLFAVPFAFDTPVTVVLAGGQHLLSIDSGSGNILPFASQTGPIAVFNGTVPSFAFLCGFSFSAQAIHFGGVVPFALSNAQDCVIGN